MESLKFTYEWPFKLRKRYYATPVSNFLEAFRKYAVMVVSFVSGLVIMWDEAFHPASGMEFFSGVILVPYLFGLSIILFVRIYVSRHPDIKLFPYLDDAYSMDPELRLLVDTLTRSQRIYWSLSQLSAEVNIEHGRLQTMLAQQTNSIKTLPFKTSHGEAIYVLRTRSNWLKETWAEIRMYLTKFHK